MSITAQKPELTPGRVRTLLKARKLSQKDLSHASGVGEADVSRICGRNMQPTPSQAQRLLEVLDPPTCTVTTGTVRVTTDGE
jgi:transcriptional regulator with XRE-family HTH domain